MYCRLQGLHAMRISVSLGLSFSIGPPMRVYFDIGAAKRRDSTRSPAVIGATPLPLAWIAAMPCQYAAARAAASGERPCDSNVAIIPVRTSPVPAVASALVPVGLTCSVV